MLGIRTDAVNVGIVRLSELDDSVGSPKVFECLRVAPLLMVKLMDHFESVLVGLVLLLTLIFLSDSFTVSSSSSRTGAYIHNILFSPKQSHIGMTVVPEPPAHSSLRFSRAP